MIFPLAHSTPAENAADLLEPPKASPAPLPPLGFDSAAPNSIFVWGYWTGTDGDTAAGHDTRMTTTVTMTSDKTVVACCPDPPPAAPTCPTALRRAPLRTARVSP